jgi:hypothetical protein
VVKLKTLGDHCETLAIIAVKVKSNPASGEAGYRKHKNQLRCRLLKSAISAGENLTFFLCAFWELCGKVKEPLRPFAKPPRPLR